MKNWMQYGTWLVGWLVVCGAVSACGQQAQLQAQLDDQQTQIAELNRQLSDAHVRIEELNNRLYLTQDQLDAIRTRQGVRTQTPRSLKQVKLMPKGESSPRPRSSEAKPRPRPEAQPSKAPIVISNWDQGGVGKASTKRKTGAAGNLVKDYRKALALYRQKRYNEAIAAFADFQRQYKPNDYTDNAIFWTGVSFFEMDEIALALTEFRKLDARSGSNKQADALYYIGQCYRKQGQTEKAREIWQELQTRHPSSDAAKRINGS